MKLDFKLPFFNKKSVSEKEKLAYGAWQNNLFSKAYSGRASLDMLYYIYNNVVDVKGAIRKIQDTTAKQGYVVTDLKGEPIKTNYVEASVIDSLYQTNTFRAFMRDFVLDLCVAGNFYWLIQKNINGEPLSLQRLDPRMMSIAVDKYGTVVGYVQRNGAGDEIRYTDDEIIHDFMDTSTYNEVLGISPIEAIVTEAKTDLKSQESSLYFYENNAVPSHLLIVEENLTDDQYTRLSKDLKAQYGGVKNKFKSGIIPFVKDIKTITPSHKDMDYVATKMLNTQKIVVAFGVDKFLLGYTDGVQRGNSEDIKQAFYDDTVRAYEVLFEEVFNTKVIPSLGLKNVKLTIPQSSFKTNTELYDRTRQDVINGIITINEARETRGLEPADNDLADELLYNGMVLDDLEFEQTTELKAFKDHLERKEKRITNLLG